MAGPTARTTGREHRRGRPTGSSPARGFLEVKEQLHFGRAAERLFLGQPTVSETVRRLERELGGQLFERSTRQVRLTPLGEAFAPIAPAAYDAVVGAYEQGRAFARDEASRFVVGHTGD